MDENKDRKVGLIKQIFNSMTYENINENMSELRVSFKRFFELKSVN